MELFFQSDLVVRGMKVTTIVITNILIRSMRRLEMNTLILISILDVY
jgi:hypothetical protein